MTNDPDWAGVIILAVFFGVISAAALVFVALLLEVVVRWGL